MTGAEIYASWYLWLGIGGAVVVAAAVLLITVLMLARRFAALAATALAVVEEIEANTKPIWELGVTHQVARELATGARAIEGSAETILDALGDPDETRAA